MKGSLQKKKLFIKSYLDIKRFCDIVWYRVFFHNLNILDVLWLNLRGNSLIVCRSRASELPSKATSIWK